MDGARGRAPGSQVHAFGWAACWRCAEVMKMMRWCSGLGQGENLEGKSAVKEGGSGQMLCSGCIWGAKRVLCVACVLVPTICLWPLTVLSALSFVI